MVNEQVLDILKGVTRKKLQEKVLEMIDMSGKGRTDKDILEFIETARKNGFSDEQALLERIVYELGEAQIRRVVAPRNKRGQPEKHLEDYLEAHGLAGMESGLNFKGRQVDLHSGTIDVDAVDATGRAVTVELKAREYDSKDVFFQIMKYAGEQKDRRFVFAAPEVYPDLFFSLQESLGAERVAFYRVLQANMDYSFERVDEKSFGQVPNRKINFDRGKKKDEGNIVSVVRGGNGQGSGRVRKTAVVAGKDNGGVVRSSLFGGLTSFEFDSDKGVYLLNGEVFNEKKFDEIKNLSWYQKILVTQPDGVRGSLKDLEKMIPFIEAQVKSLQALTYNPKIWDVINRIGDYNLAAESYSEHFSKTGKEIKVNFSNKTNKILRRLEKPILKAVKDFYDRFGEFFNNILIVAHGTFDSSTITHLETLRDEMHQELYKITSCADLNQVRTELAARFCIAPEPLQKGILGYWLRRNVLFEEEIKDEWARLKMARFRGLEQIDSALARSYLSYNPLLFDLIGGIERRSYAEFPAWIEMITETSKPMLASEAGLPISMIFVQMDQNIYTDMVNRFEEVSPKRYIGVAKMKPNSDTSKVFSSVQPREEIKIPDYLNRLGNAIEGECNGNLTPDMQARINYFVEDLTPMDNDYIEQLRGAFSSFRLGKHMRRRESVPADMKIRNFFDDVTLQYASKRKVPTKEQLERLYEKA